MSADITKIRCPHCEGKIAVEDDYYHELIGTLVSCPHCAQEMLIPAINHAGEQTASGNHSVDVTREIERPADTRRQVIQPPSDEGTFCPHCGAGIGLRDRICISCGTRMPTQDG